MAQYIRIKGKAANERIELAIPKLRAEGMAIDQATAVAIKLESQGKLSSEGAPKPKKKPGRARVGALAALAAFAPRKKRPRQIRTLRAIRRPKTTRAKRRKITRPRK